MAADQPQQGRASPSSRGDGARASEIGTVLIRQSLCRLPWGDTLTPASPHPYLLAAGSLGTGRVARRGDDQHARRWQA